MAQHTHTHTDSAHSTGNVSLSGHICSSAPEEKRGHGQSPSFSCLSPHTYLDHPPSLVPSFLSSLPPHYYVFLALIFLLYSIIQLSWKSITLYFILCVSCKTFLFVFMSEEGLLSSFFCGSIQLSLSFSRDKHLILKAEASCLAVVHRAIYNTPVHKTTLESSTVNIAGITMSRYIISVCCLENHRLSLDCRSR